MPELDEISYSREATVCAFRDYYRFLVDLYMEETEVIDPPAGGWPTISSEFQRLFGKSDEVIALLHILPYIRESGPSGEWHPPHGSPNCYWADWQSLAEGALRRAEARENSGTNADAALKVQSEGALDDVPAHVVGLTFGDRENKVFLLDPNLGIIHWPESDGGGTHRHNFDEDPSFIEPVYDVDEHVPEEEIEWRNESPAWAITDFFELLKLQYRNLKWIPINSRQVIDIDAHYETSEDGMIPMLQRIYREHGWAPDQSSTYRKQECLEAVKRALAENYPNFEGF
ncbi:hypothetical protein HYFRA_00006248 [Hymenoscyphus fraxineus]|uniref:Uncharacterized protein n=1 Tax=Hymenoscyphus fraxineus TaxID=746836 RepID=A0A9N9LC00_9HELO|nr:hypothetical protein HYFRA_00006248 [Hymenoscyphus fraxineus]